MDDTVIEIRDLKKSFGEKTVLDGVSLKIKRGQVLVILGGSGCGKSVLFKHMIGAFKADSGGVYFEGTDISQMKERELNTIRKSIGVLFQGAALFNSMTVGENIALPIRHHMDLPDDIIEIMVKMKLELVGLRDAAKLKPREISGGMQKRVALARAIALDPKVVFYDEPSTGLDPISVGVIDKLMMDLTKKMGITSITITHDMKSAFRIADYMVMLDRGKIVAEGTPDEINNTCNPLVRQFVNGYPDGPIPLRKSCKNYKTELIS